MSSSVHCISADGRPPRAVEAVWTALNLVNNSWRPGARDACLEVRRFTPTTSADELARLEDTNTPARKLSNLFWTKLPWGRVQEELGEIRVLDVGCGTGRYAKRLHGASGGRVTGYTGIDHAPSSRWPAIERTCDWARFQTGDAMHLDEALVARHTMLVSQSCIEHVREDLMLFDRLAGLVGGLDRPFLQVHLFPSAACLPLYWGHGVRQYTPRTVSRIARRFVPGSRTILFGLGGRASNRVHWRYLTWPRLLRRPERRTTDPDEYARRSDEALVRDAESGDGSPTFYALVIHSNPTRDIFQPGWMT